MNWFYSNNGQQAGPISEEELRNLLDTGIISDATLVWTEGMPNWKPAAEVLGVEPAAPAAAPSIPPPPSATPAPAVVDLAAGPAPTHMVEAILTTLCCCMPFGIASIVFAAMTSSANSSGDYIRAADCSKKAAMWAWIAFGVGLLTNGLAFAMQLFATMSEV